MIEYRQATRRAELQQQEDVREDHPAESRNGTFARRQSAIARYRFGDRERRRYDIRDEIDLEGIKENRSATALLEKNENEIEEKGDEELDIGTNWASHGHGRLPVSKERRIAG